MKKILTTILVAVVFVFTSNAQSVVNLRGDLIRIWKNGGNAELKIENATKNQFGGPLVNIGDGTTKFGQRPRYYLDTFFIGIDTFPNARGLKRGYYNTALNESDTIYTELADKTRNFTRFFGNSMTINKFTSSGNLSGPSFFNYNKINAGGAGAFGINPIRNGVEINLINNQTGPITLAQQSSPLRTWTYLTNFGNGALRTFQGGQTIRVPWGQYIGGWEFDGDNRINGTGWLGTFVSYLDFYGNQGHKIEHYADFAGGLGRTLSATDKDTVTNRYVFLAADNKPGGVGYFVQNRWGFYQEGDNTRNFFEGNTTIQDELLAGTFTGSWDLPAGTTAQRTATGLSTGRIRYNLDSSRFEGYNGSIWRGIMWTGEVTGSGSGSDSTTASNGVQLVGKDVRLGGSLIANTSINNSTFTMAFNGSGSQDVLTGNSSSTGAGIRGISSNGYGVHGSSTNGSGVYSYTTSGNPSAIISNQPSDNSNFIPQIRMERASSGTAANGISGGLEQHIQASDGILYKAGDLRWIWTNSTVGSRTSKIVLSGVNAGTSVDWLGIDNDYAYHKSDTIATRQFARDAAASAYSFSPEFDVTPGGFVSLDYANIQKDTISTQIVKNQLVQIINQDTTFIAYYPEKNKWDIYAEFTGNFNGDFVSYTLNSGTVGVVTILDSLTLGLARLSTATSANASPAIASGEILAFNSVYDYVLEMPDFRLTNLNSGTDSCQAFAGFGDNWNTTNRPTDGAYFWYSASSANFRCVTTSNGVNTETITSTAVAANTNYDFKIVANRFQVLFYINNTLVATHTTNIPVTVARATGIIYNLQKKGGTATFQSYLDAIKFRKDER